MKKYLFQFAVLLVIAFLAINDGIGVESLSDEEIRKNLNSIKSRPGFKQKDCAYKDTIKTLDWLIPENYSGSDLDKKRTDLVKLRQFLSENGFIEKPGSVVIINAQDRIMRLTCGNDKTSTAKFSWRSEGRVSDEDFKKKDYDTVEHIAQPPAYSMYFRKYICSIKSKKPSCTHVFYIITRLAAKVDTPQHHRESASFSINCEINSCLYENKKTKKCPTPFKTAPKFYPPDKIYWTIAGKSTPIEKDSWKTNIDKKWNGTIEWKNYPSTYNKYINKTFNNFPISSTIKVASAVKAHAGFYECVVQDINGIPSTPTKGSISDTTYHGTVVVHIREWYWIYIPLACLALIAIIMILIQFCCPLHMEHDDGTVYTKEELGERAKNSNKADNTKEASENAKAAENGGGEVSGPENPPVPDDPTPENSSPPEPPSEETEPKPSKATMRSRRPKNNAGSPRASK